jgi:hypothetical protein
VDHLTQKIINVGWRAAWEFDLHNLRRIVVVDTIRDAGAKVKWFGACDTFTGEVFVRTMSRHPIPRRLSDVNIMDTLSHELAHLVEPGHGRAHLSLGRMLYRYIERRWSEEIKTFEVVTGGMVE